MARAGSEEAVSGAGHHFTGEFPGWCECALYLWDENDYQQHLPLAEMLAEVYKPDGVTIWLTALHKDWGLTVEQMFKEGRHAEVLAKAEQLVTGAYS